MSMNGEPREANIHKHALKFLITYSYMRAHTHTHTHAHLKMVSESLTLGCSERLPLNPPDTPWEVIIHKRGGFDFTYCMSISYIQK